MSAVPMRSVTLAVAARYFRVTRQEIRNRVHTGQQGISYVRGSLRLMYKIPMRRPKALVDGVPTISPFWTAQCKAMSTQLLLPVGLGPADKRLVSSTDDLDIRSWYSTKTCPLRSSEEVPVTSPQVMAEVQRLIIAREQRDIPPPKPVKRRLPPPKPGAPAKPVEVKADLKTRKLRIYPTKSQQGVLKLWFEGARYAYNLAVDYLNPIVTAHKQQGEYVPNETFSKAGLRAGANVSTGAAARVKGKKMGPAKANGWEAQAPKRLWPVPAKIRDAAVIDLHNACKALVAKENRMKRTFKLRCKKDLTWTMSIESAQINCKTKRHALAPLFGTVTDRSNMRVESSMPLPLVFIHDVRIQYERLTDTYYLCLPMECPRPKDVQARRAPRIAAIDPGVRTFGTIYDVASSRIVEWATTGGRKNGHGKGTELLGWLVRKISRIEWRAKKLRCAHKYRNRRRQRMRAVANRIRQRIRDLKKDLHHKMAVWLCKTYDTVLLPRFAAKGMSRRKGLPAGKKRCLARTTVRKMAQLSPFEFRMFLLHKAKEYGTRVIICDEQYTSKTCTNCGLLNTRLGSSKKFICPHCAVTYDRDAGAARNILLRYIR